jgi:1-acyl-sn-glycerol-3-phosphate acyltransferase
MKDLQASGDWQADVMAVPPPGAAGWLRVQWRGIALAVVVFGGLVLHSLIRLAELPLPGPRRPVSPFVTQAVCRTALRILRLRLSIRGTPIAGGGALVANHGSWLDVFVLNACTRMYFVSKDEVAGWPGIGLLARVTDTLFIRRQKTHAKLHENLLRDRLRAGHLLTFFPEGTSTDAIRILPFKTTLFAAFFDPELKDGLQVQPVTVNYRAPAGLDPRWYGWWGDMGFGQSLLAILAAARAGGVEVTFHPPLTVSAFADRKALAAAAEAAVRSAFAYSG